MNALIVEDHVPTSQILSRTLSGCGYDSSVCFSAEDALKLLDEKGAGYFHLFLLDLILPGIDGISLCRWVRSHQEDAEPYVIVGTGCDPSDELANAFDAGADDYIVKPYHEGILNVRFAVAAEQISARSEQRRLNNELNREKDLIAAVFDTAAAYIVALDSTGRIAMANQAACKLTGFSEPELEGKPFEKALIADDDEHSRSILESFVKSEMKDGEICQFESRFINPDGAAQSISWLCRSVEENAGDGRLRAGKKGRVIVCVGTDVTERRKMESDLAFLAERDPLTNLYNRSQLEPAIKKVIAAAQTGHQAAIISVDLDDFKSVNDSAGHAVGDDLLQMVASTLSESVRPSDTVIRLGGDEFVLVLPDSSRREATAVASRIRRAIDELDFCANRRTFHVTASLGVVAIERHMNVEQALGLADAACYDSKNRGRNSVTVAGANRLSSAQNSNDSTWRDRITRSLADESFELWVQPIVSVDSSETIFSEALLRLPGEDGWHTPGAFMSSARRFNLLQEIDHAVIHRAIRMIQSNPGLSLAVNLSGRSAGDSRLPSFLIDEVQSHEIDPSRLIFEITESDLISDFANAIDRLQELRSQGFRFALDDFGKGYSSFNYLRKLPVEIVKIDGSYIRKLHQDDQSLPFLRAITVLAHSIGLKCVAEQIEDQDAFDIIREIGVDLAQGFFLGKPKPLDPNRIGNDSDLVALPA